MNHMHDAVNASSLDHAFPRMVQLIRNHGGFVNTGISCRSRTLRVTTQLEANSVLMKIPSSVLITEAQLPEDISNQIRSKLNQSCAKMALSERLQHVRDMPLAYCLSTERCEAIATYIATTETPLLPLSWSDEEIELLQPSPLYKVVEKQRQQHLDDCRVLGMEENEMRRKFRDAICIVNSRAFVGRDDVPTMVPLLDLCNHARGPQKKNLSYSWQLDGSVLVQSIAPLHVGDILWITYGARSNSHLLQHYGFCLIDNVEPDGSSNDTLPWRGVLLQVGPKSYTYGILTSLLGLFSGKGDDTRDYDFTNAEHEDVNWEDVAASATSNKVDNDLRALDVLTAQLEDSLLPYYKKGDSVSRISQQCCILLQSEMEILQFYVCVCRSLSQRIRNIPRKRSDKATILLSKQHRGHLESLVESFVQIRYMVL